MLKLNTYKRLPGNLAPWALLITVVLSSVYIWQHELQANKTAIQMRLEREAERVQTAILARLDEYEDILRATRGFLATNQPVTDNQWHTFVQTLELDNHYPSLLGLGYIECVTSSQLASFEADRRADNVPDFTLKPVGVRPDYFIIKYIEPLANNQPALGYDVGSEPTRRAAAEQARDSGLPAITGKIILVQDNQNLPGFLFYLPVYRAGMPTSTVEQRRLALQGWVYVPFRADDFMRGILGTAKAYVDFEIFDGISVDQTSRQSLIYDDDNVLHGIDSNKTPAKITRLTIAGRDWTIRYIPLTTFEQVNQEGQSWLILVAGLLGSFLIFLITWGLARSSRRALGIAEDTILKLETAKTELSRKEVEKQALLSAIPDLMVRLNRSGRILEVNESVQTIAHKPVTELLGKNLTEAYPLNIAAKITHYQHQLFETGHLQHFEYEIIVATSDKSGATEQIWYSDVRLVLINEHEYLAIVRDVTESKQAELAFRQNQAILSSFYNSAPMLMGVVEVISNKSQAHPDQTTRDIRHISDNAAAGRFFGHSPENMQNKLASELGVPESVREQWLDYYWQSKLANQPVCFEYSHDTAHNAGWLAATVCYVGVTAEGQERFSYIVEDVTKRKKAEEALTASQLQLQDFLDNANDLIQSVTPDGRYTYVNQAWLTTLGYTHQEVASLNMFDIIHPDSREHCQAMLKKVMAGEVVKNVETTFISSDGRIVIVEGSANCRFDDNGKPVLTRSIFRNITRRKQIEQELQEQRDFAFQVMNNMGQGLTVTNQENCFEYINPAYASLLGYTPQELIGQTPYFVTFEEDHQVLTSARQSRQKGLVTTYETRLRHKSGQEVYVLITGVPYIKNNQLVGAIAVISNLTERKKAELALTQAHNQALEASRLKSEFVANMSHEIRTPLSSIISIVDLLMTTPLNTQQQEFTQIARSSAYTLLGLINDILDFSKIEANKLTLEKLAFEPVKVIEEAAEIVASKAHDKNLNLMTFVAPEVATLLLGDPARLRQVLLNLLGNAIKFTEQGDVVVRATSDKVTANHQVIKVEVIDKGIGLSSEAKNRLFQPFTQADGSTTRKYGGTGLGLSISKHLIELMGGQIGVESEGEGWGSTFWFSIPFDLPAREDTFPVINNLTIASNFNQVSLKGRKVLIVDDSKSYRDIIYEYLISWGICGAVASNGEEALTMLSEATFNQTSYDIVIIDFDMPEMDGFALAKIIEQKEIFKRQGNRNSLPLVMLTAFDNATQGQQAIHAGFAAYLVKPVKQSQLFNTLTRVMAASLSAAQPLFKNKEAETQFELEKDKTIQLAKKQYSDKLILLAEDNQINQKLALLQIQRLGFRVEGVSNGYQVLAALGQKKYDLILMDCQMPEMDGFEATRLIRLQEKAKAVTTRDNNKQNPTGEIPLCASTETNQTFSSNIKHIPIIAMTANAMQGDREICLAAGMDDYISKPVNTERLHSLLRYWLDVQTPVPMLETDSTQTQAGATDRLPITSQVMVPPPTDKQIVLDLEMLNSLRNLVKTPKQFKKIVELYLTTTQQQLAELNQAYEQKITKRLHEIAHSLKSSSANLGVFKLAELCKVLETLEVAGDQRQIADLLVEINTVFNQAKSHLTALLLAEME